VASVRAMGGRLRHAARARHVHWGFAHSQATRGCLPTGQHAGCPCCSETGPCTCAPKI